jgi:hypothetical protein
MASAFLQFLKENFMTAQCQAAILDFLKGACQPATPCFTTITMD